MNSFFNWLKDSGTQAIELFITACAAIGALLLTWYFGRKSLTKRDLSEMERNTAESTQHLRRQTQRDQLAARIERIQLEVWGQGPVGHDLDVYIRCPETDALPTRISLYNEHGSLFGTSGVVRTPSGDYGSQIDAATADRWFRGGTRVVVGQGHTRVVLRINLAIDGQEGFREIAASLRQRIVESDRGRLMCCELEGSV